MRIHSLPIFPLLQGSLLAQAPAATPAPAPAQEAPKNKGSWELLEKEELLKTVPGITQTQRSFVSADDINQFLRKSTLGFDTGFRKGGRNISLSELLTQNRTLTKREAQIIVDTVKGAKSQKGVKVIKDPGSNPSKVRKGIEDFLKARFWAHAELNYYSRIVYLDQTHLANAGPISFPPEVLQVFFKRTKEIEEVLYQSYKNVVGRLAQADPTGLSIQEDIFSAKLILLTGITDSNKALDTFTQGIRYPETATEETKAKRTAMVARRKLAQAWFQSAPPIPEPVAAQKEAPPPAQPTPPAAKPALPPPPPAEPKAVALKQEPAPSPPAKPAQAPQPQPTPPAPKPAKKPGPSTEELLAAAAKLPLPKMFGLSPLNNGREMILKECQSESQTRSGLENLANYICSLDAGNVQVQARNIFRTDNKDWTPWQYRVNSQIINSRSKFDVGLIIYMDGNNVEGQPFQKDSEIQEKAARFLSPNYPLPTGISLSHLTVANSKKMVVMGECTEDTDWVTSIRRAQNTLETDRVEGIGKSYTCKDYYVKEKPTLIVPLIVQEQGGNKVYRLGKWVWRLPDRPLPIDATPDRKIAVLKEKTEEPFFYGVSEELFEQMTDRIFPKTTDIRTAPQKEEGLVYGKPSACQKGGIQTDWKNLTQSVLAQCQFPTGESLPVTFSRQFNLEPSGDELLHSVSDWVWNIQTPTGHTLKSGVAQKETLTITTDEEGVAIFEHDSDAELRDSLQEEFETRFGDRFFPEVFSLGLSGVYLNSSQTDLVRPEISPRHSEKATDFHEDAADVSERNAVHRTIHGGMAALQLTLHPLSVAGIPWGGLFLRGGGMVGGIGQTGGEATYLAEAQVGGGISLRNTFGWDPAFDLSGHALFYKQGWTGDDDILPDYGEGLPQAGACAHFDKVQACFDYWWKNPNDVDVLLFSLGYNVFRPSLRPNVEIR